MSEIEKPTLVRLGIGVWMHPGAQAFLLKIEISIKLTTPLPCCLQQPIGLRQLILKALKLPFLLAQIGS
ncbi:hypothetical protein ASF19_23800 [Acidovorax sp. Leaf84]|nr:hypothetical protein ASF19_23800 [Acidovorax sp. Leaf84]